MKPRIAVFLQPQHAEYDQIRQAALEAEEMVLTLFIIGIISILYTKKMELNGPKEKEEKESILNVGLCLLVGLKQLAL